MLTLVWASSWLLMSTYWSEVLRFRSSSAALLSFCALRALDLGQLLLHVAQLLFQHADARIGLRRRGRLFARRRKLGAESATSAAPARRSECESLAHENPVKIIPPASQRTGRGINSSKSLSSQ